MLNTDMVNLCFNTVNTWVKRSPGKSFSAHPGHWQWHLLTVLQLKMLQRIYTEESIQELRNTNSTSNELLCSYQDAYGSCTLRLKKWFWNWILLTSIVYSFKTLTYILTMYLKWNRCAAKQLAQEVASKESCHHLRERKWLEIWSTMTI